MSQMTKGGKYIFDWSMIRVSGSLMEKANDYREIIEEF